MYLRRVLCLGFALALLFALGGTLPRLSNDRTSVAMAAEIIPPPEDTYEPVGSTSPAPPVVAVPVNPQPVTIPTAVRTIVRAQKRDDARQLGRLHREITWWRTRATKAAKQLGRDLHFARLSRELDRAKQQKSWAVTSTWHHRTLVKRREAQHFAYLINGKKPNWRTLQKAYFDESDYDQAVQLADRWQQKWENYLVFLGKNPEEAIEYAAHYWGVSADWLKACAKDEGGLGPMKWNGGAYDSNPYDGRPPGTRGSRAYGTMQFMQGTFEGHVIYSNAPLPHRWNDALDQAMTAAWMFKHGLSWHWEGDSC